MASPYITVLEAVNEVCDRLNVRRVSATTQNLFVRNLVNIINDTVEDLCDFGRWNELQASAAVTMVCGQSVYDISTVSLGTAKRFIHSIQEVYVSGRIASLEPISDKNEFRLLIRTGSIGTPSRYAVDGTDALSNPRLGLFPRPGSTYAGDDARVRFQILPPRYVPGDDDNVVMPFPGRVMVAGLHAGAILDESGGVQTDQYRQAQAKYFILRNNSLGRQTAKTGEFTRFQPGMTTRT
jgi:hypothetical protein